jgi:hypothetical protein
VKKLLPPVDAMKTSGSKSRGKVLYHYITCLMCVRCYIPCRLDASGGPIVAWAVSSETCGSGTSIVWRERGCEGVS